MELHYFMQPQSEVTPLYALSINEMDNDKTSKKKNLEHAVETPLPLRVEESGVAREMENLSRNQNFCPEQ